MDNNLRHHIVGALYYFQIFISYLPSHLIRKFLLKNIYGLTIEKSSALYHGFEIRGAKNIFIGKNSIIGNKVILDGRYGLKIGNNVNIGTRVTIWTAQHDYNSTDFLGIGASVEIQDYAWIASEATIMPGVKIGKGAVVAAKALVTKDVEDYTVVGGIPAKKIASRRQDLTYNLSTSILPYV